MTIDMKDFLSAVTDVLHRIDYIKPEDLPNIDLYMDQVTTFMDSQLEASKRYPEDKILTKTMINNYESIYGSGHNIHGKRTVSYKTA